MSERDVARQVQEAVLRRVATDDLALPSLPAAAQRALDLLSRDDYELREIASLIEKDPLLAARLLRLANSAAFGGAQKVDSILGCVTRLGATEVRVLLFETAARQVLESHDRRIVEICRGLWEHSLAVAVLARDVAMAARSPAAGGAYLAGLLHDVGKPILAAMLLEAEQRLLGKATRTWIVPETWLRLIAESHRNIGVALAERWGLPEEVGRSIQSCGEYDTAEPRSLANVVRFANALAKKAGVYVGAVDQDEIASLIFVGQQLFDLDAADADSLIEGLHDRVGYAA